MKIDRQPEHGIAGGFNFPPQRVIGRKVPPLDSGAELIQVVQRRPQPGQEDRALLGGQIVRVHPASVAAGAVNMQQVN